MHPDPLVLIIVGDEIKHQHRLSLVMKERGWRIETICVAAGRKIPQEAMLILCTGADVGSEADALRACGALAVQVPVLALVDNDIGARSPGFAAYIDSHWPVERQADAIDRWRPGAAAVAVARLEGAFGRAEIRKLLIGLRASLIHALDRLDQPDGAEHAHHMAGMAGTLGFAAVGRAWRAVSEGEGFDASVLRRQTELAIVEIDQIVAAAGQPE